MRKRRTDLEEAALRLAEVVGPADCVLVGGLAVGLYGLPRGTDDVDLIARVPLAVVRQRLQRAGIPSRLFRGDPLEGDFPSVKGEVEGIAFDVMPPLVALVWDRAKELDLGGRRLRLVDVDGLIALKLKAQGPQDLLDAAGLVLRHPATEPTAMELAERYRLADRFRALLESARLRAQVKRQAGRERRRARPRARGRRR